LPQIFGMLTGFPRGRVHERAIAVRAAKKIVPKGAARQISPLPASVLRHQCAANSGCWLSQTWFATVGDRALASERACVR